MALIIIIIIIIIIISRGVNDTSILSMGAWMHG